jgi:hypothetical protein
MAFFAAGLTILFLFCSSFIYCGEVPRKIVSGYISSAPILDGKPDDPAWAGLNEFRVALLNGEFAKVKIGVDSQNIYILLRFKGQGRDKHSRWHWDSTRQIYVSGDEKEDIFSIFWSETPVFDRGDAWLWRAALTNPSAFADDCFFVKGNTKDYIFEIDKGVNSWRVKYFFAFAGEFVDRFYSRAPSGSAADVKAKGRWSKGEWTVEFSRKIKTKHADDIDFSGNKKLYVIFSSEMPEMRGFPGTSSVYTLELKSGTDEKN